MHQLSKDSVKSVGQLQPGHQNSVPHSVLLRCHSCNVLVAMNPNGPWYRQFQGFYIANYICPACSAHCKLVFTSDPNDAGWQPTGDDSQRLFVWPHPRGAREINPYFLDELIVPKRIGSSYAKAVAVLGVEHSASAVHSRKTLEGIAKHLVPNAQKNTTLFNLLEQIKSTHDFAAPIAELAHALRAGGNLAAHFDSEDDVDNETAIAMLELLEDLIELLFVLPAKIKSLQVKLSNKSANTE